jgi:aryl-alcohol dehydrogenase-like predicted oxidoreductase
MSGAYGPADEHESTATLHRALDLGINFLDTADVYGDGHNESLIGRVLNDRRRGFVLASKTGWVKRLNADGTTSPSVDTRPERVRAACDASLARLQTDVIDLYYLHRIDPTVPVEESVGAVAELVARGKVRWIGLSECSVETLRLAHRVHPVTALQSEYSLWTREPESTVLPVCAELGITFVPFSPLGRGFLTGSVTAADQIGERDWRANNPRFSGESLTRNVELLRPLETIARAHGCTPAQVALAWVLARGEDVVPIPGTRRRDHLEANVAALNLELTADELALLEKVFPPGVAAGERYTPEVARWAGL